jgi:hypothetical protein
MENQKKIPKDAPEVLERAMRTLFEHADQNLSQWELSDEAVMGSEGHGSSPHQLTRL